MTGSSTSHRKPYLPVPPKIEEEMTDQEVEAVYADYHSKCESARKNFIRDVNAAWRWVVGTDPPRRNSKGEKTKQLRYILDQIDAKRQQGDTERPMRYRTPSIGPTIVAQAETPDQTPKKPRKRTKEGETQ